MNYQLNPVYNYIYDSFQKKGYVVHKNGSCSVVNEDAMQLMLNYGSDLTYNTCYQGFRQRVERLGWLLPCNNTVSAVSVREVPIPYHLKRIQLELLLQCNLRCMHCYCSSSPTAPKGLDTEKIFNLIDQASKMGVLYLDITGGEPLIRRDIFQIIERAQKQGLVLSLFTNATVINDQIAQRLSHLKIASIQTSLDTFTPELHDQFRGLRGAHKRAVAGIHLLKKYNIPVSVTIMVHQGNKHELKQLTDFIKTYLGVPFRLDRVIPSGRAKENKDMSLTSKEFYELTKALFPNQKTITTKVCEFASALIGKTKIEPSCGVGSSYLFIKHNGNVVLCPTMTEEESPLFKAGNFLEQSLQEIWLNHPTFRKFRGIQCRNIGVCPVSKICRGGCRSNTYLLHGTVDAPDELHCNIYKNALPTYVPFLKGYIKNEHH